MSRLYGIQNLIQDTDAAIAELDRAIAAEPSPALYSMAAPLQKRKRELEAQFLEAAKSLGRKVCSYRLFQDGKQPKVKDFANSLGGFQNAFSVTFNAVRVGPRERARISSGITQESSFDFAYAFTGSVGVVLTMPEEQFTFGASDFEVAIDAIAEVAKSQTPEQISQEAKKIGPAAIQTIYVWAKAHANSLSGAEIQWTANEGATKTVLVQTQEFRHLVETIERTTAEIPEKIEAVGKLFGVEFSRKSFHLRLGDGTDIRGSFENAITESHEVKVPSTTYRASMTKTTRVKLATGEISETYFLDHLDEV